MITRRAFDLALLNFTVILCCLGILGIGNTQENPQVKLVLQITVDGLRGDLLSRYGDRFGESGFNYLLDNGVVFTNAHYQHANTETIVGHTTLATGAFPSEHGMLGNVWFDREAGELSYNIEDPEHLPIPTRDEEIKGDQVDPAQKLARTPGRSPTVILAETLSDRMMAYYGGRSKVFGVSGKDRSAVAMAGKTGKAFWFSSDNGDFVTTTYYYDAYPEWVSEWNARRQAESHAGTYWNLLHDVSTYLLGHQDDRPYEADLRGYGRVFPHQFGMAGNKLLPTQIVASPVGDRLLLDFAKVLVRREQVGQDAIPDYLSISFSGVDAVNHFFGPSSLENEDMVLQLDQTLADLFTFIDESIGLKHTLIVLSADHGMPEMPEYMSELGFSAGRLYPEDVVSAANEIGQRLFGIHDVVQFYYRPYLYLDESKIPEDTVLSKVAQALAEALTDTEGITLAVSRGGLTALQETPLLKRIQKNFHPSRAGDIYVVQDPYWFNFDKGPVATAHGSPWRYDTHVPIIFAGPGVTAGTVHRRVHPVDVAPTLATVLGMTPPSSAQGTVLAEVLE